MHRRLGFVLSLIGMSFAVMPLAAILPKPDFIMLLGGLTFLLLGIFFTIETLVRDRK
jgi:hypothetical protein